MRRSILVFSSLFPSAAAPGNGLFVRERMFRVADHAHVDMVVVSPTPWFPGQGIIRRFKKDYRPQPCGIEMQHGIAVYSPRFLAFPGILRNLDAVMMYLFCLGLVRRLVREHGIEIIDSHFTYPDGLAATWLARKFGLKSIITLRGTEVPHAKIPGRVSKLLQAWRQADRVFSVSDSLRQHAISLGAQPDKFRVVGNGIDTEKFQALDPANARERLGIARDARVLVTVGGLVERQGVHRVVECLPPLIKEYPDLVYLLVGGANAEGDYSEHIRERAEALGVSRHLVFLGALEPSELSGPLSAADVFVLATSNEGWANVILESMACGTPVIATDVGGNAEVVNSAALGSIVPFGDSAALTDALLESLRLEWPVAPLTEYALQNHWDTRIEIILDEYNRLCSD